MRWSCGEGLTRGFRLGADLGRYCCVRFSCDGIPFGEVGRRRGYCGQSLLGRRVSFTKQESQTRVPSFRVKSTRRLGSISAPHFPHRSTGVSLIGWRDFTTQAPQSAKALDARNSAGAPSGNEERGVERLGSLVLGRWRGVHVREGIKAAVAIFAAVDADADDAKQVSFDGAATMGPANIVTSAIRAQAFRAGEGWLRGCVVLVRHCEFRHCCHLLLRTILASCKTRRMRRLFSA
jgi:hypothetical protein